MTRNERKRLDRFTREAERYVAVLGDMKGVAMKVGQLLSFLDAGAIPEQHRAGERRPSMSGDSSSGRHRRRRSRHRTEQFSGSLGR